MNQELKKCRVLVTPTTFGSYDKRLCQELEVAVGEVIYNRRGRQLTSEELKELLPGCNRFIAGTDRMGWESLRDWMAVLRGETPLHPVVARGAKA